ncbi:MAG TPA: hypothetical protein VHO47_03375 [Candidatus Babeliales bacterium]|nr:hypothetical protein [Candidatus Babeliales bacterium]
MASRWRLWHLLRDCSLFAAINFLVFTIFFNAQSGSLTYYNAHLAAFFVLLGFALRRVWRQIPESLSFLYALIINLVFASMLIPCTW